MRDISSSIWMKRFWNQNLGTKLTEEQVVDYVTAPMKEHPELPVFSYGQDPKENNFFFTVSNFSHLDLYSPYYFYNSLKVLFH